MNCIFLVFILPYFVVFVSGVLCNSVSSYLLITVCRW